jgi:hypothetical protein
MPRLNFKVQVDGINYIPKEPNVKGECFGCCERNNFSELCDTEICRTQDCIFDVDKPKDSGFVINEITTDGKTYIPKKSKKNGCFSCCEVDNIGTDICKLELCIKYNCIFEIKVDNSSEL